MPRWFNWKEGPPSIAGTAWVMAVALPKVERLSGNPISHFLLTLSDRICANAVLTVEIAIQLGEGPH